MEKTQIFSNSVSASANCVDMLTFKKYILIDWSFKSGFIVTVRQDLKNWTIVVVEKSSWGNWTCLNKRSCPLMPWMNVNFQTSWTSAPMRVRPRRLERAATFQPAPQSTPKSLILQSSTSTCAVTPASRWASTQVVAPPPPPAAAGWMAGWSTLLLPAGYQQAVTLPRALGRQPLLIGRAAGPHLPAVSHLRALHALGLHSGTGLLCPPGGLPGTVSPGGQRARQVFWIFKKKI